MLDFTTGWYRKASRFFTPESGTGYTKYRGNFLSHQLDYAGTACSRSVLYRYSVMDGRSVLRTYLPWQWRRAVRLRYTAIIDVALPGIQGEDLKNGRGSLNTPVNKTSEELTVTTGINAYL